MSDVGRVLNDRACYGRPPSGGQQTAREIESELVAVQNRAGSTTPELYTMYYVFLLRSTGTISARRRMMVETIENLRTRSLWDTRTCDLAIQLALESRIRIYPAAVKSNPERGKRDIMLPRHYHCITILRFFFALHARKRGCCRENRRFACGGKLRCAKSGIR